MAPSKVQSPCNPEPTWDPADALTLDQLLRTQALRAPNEPYILYPKSKATYEEYTNFQINNFAYRVSKRYSETNLARSNSSSPLHTVALLGTSNLDYVVSIYALSKLGWTILFLSTRISDAAYKSLLEKTNCSDVVVQAGFERTIARVKDNFPSLLNIITMAGPNIYDPKGLRDEWIPIEWTAFDQGFDHAQESEKPVWILHSSGSTGLPKPIPITHKAALYTAKIVSEDPMTALTTLPLYHIYGLMAVTGALACGKRIAMFNADIPITGPNMVETLKAVNVELLYSVPYTIKLLAEAPEGIEALIKQKKVVFGGSSCPDELGNKLVFSGVNLVSFYGSTENGACMASIRDSGDNDWNYLHPLPSFWPYAQWESVIGNLYELVVKVGWQSQSLSNRPDGSYATHDLWAQHPTDPSKYKYYGRVDDTLVLSNGEKANPDILELHVRENQYVREVVVCGAQRAHLGMLVIPNKTAGMEQDEIAEKIWASTEQGNKDMPAYARIMRNMISFLPVDTEFPRTDKGTVIRAAFYTKFADRIEQLYQDFDAQDNSHGKDLSEAELKEFVRNEISKILNLDPNQIQDETDFFELGLDSLGAMEVKNKVSYEINTTEKISQNIVFEHPTISRLAGHLHRLVTGTKEVVQLQVNLLKPLIEKYANFPQHVPGKSNTNGNYIAITGATGSLGAHIVAQLVVRDSVKKVYCLVRATSARNAIQRTIQSLEERHLYGTMTLEQLKKIAAFPSDFNSETLGLSPEIYNELLENVNIVIHSAWSVNFNMDVMSFEQHIRGSYNLMSLCLNSHRAAPASFSFASSISAVLSTPSPSISETEFTSLENAMPIGYAQSKLVTEKLCAVAANKTILVARVLRIGQVVGDTINGCWNATEAIPLTVQSALTIGCLPRPTNDEALSWLPVDVVAKTCIELSLVPGTSTAHNAVFNVSHPQLISWNKDFLPALKENGLKFEDVTPTEWIRRLKASNQDPKVNPPVKLLEFFEAKYKDDTVTAMPYFKTDEARKYSSALNDCEVVDKNLVGKFLKFWDETAW